MKKLNNIQGVQTIIEPALAAADSHQAFTRLLRGLGDHLAAGLMVFVWEEKDELISAVSVQEPMPERLINEMVAEAIGLYEHHSGRKNNKRVIYLWDGVKPLASDGQKNCQTRGWPVTDNGAPAGYFLLGGIEDTLLQDGTLGLVEDMTAFFARTYRLLETARSAATHDPMTGLYNRSYLEQQYLTMARSCSRYDHQMAVIFVDIDYFKSINDTYGHAAGDQVLIKFSETLQTMTRKSDVLGRYGGDEFVILLPKADDHEALNYAGRLHEIMKGTEFYSSGHSLFLTLSMGIACGNPLANGETGEKFSLLERADSAVYRAKKSGRDRIHVWTADLLPKPKKKKPVESTVKNRFGKEKNGSILLVDDEPGILTVLQKGLRLEGYTCETFQDSREALKKITAMPYAYDLVITDIQMSGMDGITLIREVKKVNESIFCLAISGKATVDSAVKSLRHGAYDFIKKPVHLRHLFSTVERTLAYRSVVMENERYQNHLSEMVREKSAELDKTLEEVKRSYAFTLESLISLLDAREKDFGQHSKRVRDLSMLLARKMGLSEDMVETVGQGALLHDIGKIAVPDHILLKKTTLTNDEWEVMRKHTETGYSILSSSKYLKNVAEIVFSHHEYYNGEGYPKGLQKDEICLGARIFAVIDAYDAIRSTRTYKAAQSAQDALAEIEKGAGSQFDPQVVGVFKHNHKEMEAMFLELH